ncbi:hypothetical protein DWG14_06415 [Streptomyces griseorubiginosus]|uniref:Uncharacterized protein n=1 Tax=Streptomyces griseorubiginosus TaxID=67304 RepID=A0AAI8PQ52_9ACTN|nr:hypothetical protein DWG14_06415 [Streptomyces griseorubiginosus]
MVRGHPGDGFAVRMAPPHYEFRMRGPISRTVLDVIRTRFDHVSTPGADGTVLVVHHVDQASVRALLTLLWDTGHHVLAFEEKTA